ncbi:MAG: chemotaxis protein CheW [Acidimicrobiales bacterium]
MLPIVDLRTVLGSPVADSEVANVVVLQADDRQFGVVVDEIHETQEIVVKPLGQVQPTSRSTGATILGDGRVAVILDVLGLAQHAGIISAHGEGNPLHEFLDAAEVRASTEMTTLLLLALGEGRRVALPCPMSPGSRSSRSRRSSRPAIARWCSIAVASCRWSTWAAASATAVGTRASTQRSAWWSTNTRVTTSA